MTELTENQLNQYAHQMLEDYDSKTPGTIFKDKVRIGVEDAWRIQSAVTYLRQKRDELSICDKVLMDLEYMSRLSFWFDMKILWKTFLKVIKRHGVSH